MKKGIVYIVLLALVGFIATACVFKEKAETPEREYCVSNSMFSITLPKEVKGSFILKKRDNGIFIYDKLSDKAGFGGFAFGVKAFMKPSDYAMMPGGRKIGELKKGHKIYDMVLIQPTDVQFDYVNGKSETYDKLYELADGIGKRIKGKSKYLYCNNGGMKGEDLYSEILQKHIKAIKEKWDSSKLEKEEMSYMYNVLASSGKNVLDTVGYAYYDVNGDGIEELLIGEITEGQMKGVIYDLYTMVNRKPMHVVSGGARNRYYVTDDVFVCNEYSIGADERYWIISDLVSNSTELFLQVSFKYDGYTNKKNPWFLSYNSKDKEWQSVSKDTFKERKAIFETYIRFNYIPLSTLEKK